MTAWMMTMRADVWAHARTRMHLYFRTGTYDVSGYNRKIHNEQQQKKRERKRESGRENAQKVLEKMREFHLFACVKPVCITYRVCTFLLFEMEERKKQCNRKRRWPDHPQQLFKIKHFTVALDLSLFFLSHSPSCRCSDINAIGIALHRFIGIVLRSTFDYQTVTMKQGQHRWQQKLKRNATAKQINYGQTTVGSAAAAQNVCFFFTRNSEIFFHLIIFRLIQWQIVVQHDMCIDGPV